MRIIYQGTDPRLISCGLCKARLEISSEDVQYQPDHRFHYVTCAHCGARITLHSELRQMIEFVEAKERPAEEPDDVD